MRAAIRKTRNDYKSIDDYKDWLLELTDQKYSVSDATISYYQRVTRKLKQDFERSHFWLGLKDAVAEYDSIYIRETKDCRRHLFIPALYHSGKFFPKVEVKSWNSFFKKTFRKNILWNENFDKEPLGGWILPDNWFSKINDIIRTRFIVSSLDGVAFMAKQLEQLCHEAGIQVSLDYKARDEGYYAIHVDLSQECEIPEPNVLSTKRIRVQFELQVTTRLQMEVAGVNHKYYEGRKMQPCNPTAIKWQWDYTSDEFVVNYLGHILHFVDGMLVQVRSLGKEAS